MKRRETWSDIYLVYAIVLPIWRTSAVYIFYESFSSCFCCSSHNSCPEMRVISNYASVILQLSKLCSNALFVVQTAFHIIKKKKKKGLNRHKFLFCHFGNFCFMFVWLMLFFHSFFFIFVFCFFFLAFVFCFFLSILLFFFSFMLSIVRVSSHYTLLLHLGLGPARFLWHVQIYPGGVVREIAINLKIQWQYVSPGLRKKLIWLSRSITSFAIFLTSITLSLWSCSQ